MISYLRLQNFRRHSDTELYFDDGDQVVLLAGENGTGKSSITEAITYALYGESRAGRRGLDDLVRRGAELEGLEVELDFSVSSHVYKVKRRRDNRVSSAVLYCDGVALTEGATEVSNEIANLLGMDSKGFRLSTFAQQKELDGLATMGAPERRKMLSRLLRVDAVERARDAAGAKFREERVLASRLGGTDVALLKTTVQEHTAIRDEAVVNAATAGETVDRLTADIEESAWVDTAVEAALQRAEDAKSEHLSASDEVNHISEEIGKVAPVASTVIEDFQDVETLISERASLVAAIEKATNTKRQAQQSKSLANEIVKLKTELAEANAASGQVGMATQAVIQAAKGVADLTSEYEASKETLDGLKADHATLKGRMDAADEALERAKSVDGECDACGQSVSEDHRHTQVDQRLGAVQTLRSGLEKVLASGASSAHEVKSLQEACELSRQGEALAKEDLRDVSELAASIPNLEARISLAEENLSVLVVGDTEDKPALEEQLGRLEVALASARSVAALVERKHIASATLLVLETQMERAVARVEAAQVRVEAADVSSSMEAKQAERVALREQLSAAATAKDVCAELVSSAQVALAGSDARLAAAAEVAEKQSEAIRLAEVASVTKDVLADVSAALHAQIRPALEGLVSEIVATMSNGRFDSVRITDKWEINVRDDAKFRGLKDLSGGEQDLVALAVRLGLNAVVAERHGSGGAGFIILDEPLGSLDESRRASVLDSLRNLRGAPQVWLISHVGGCEDAADVVVQVSRNDEPDTIGVSTVEVL